MSIVRAISRANSHIRYWRYRQRMHNGGPSLVSSLRQWLERVRFELRNNP